jgi:hypothetical protein
MSDIEQQPAPPSGASTCGTCRYAQNRIAYDNMLHCRRLPPIWTGHMGHAVRPLVEANDWCGEYQQGTPSDPTVALPTCTSIPYASQAKNVVNCTMGNWTGMPDSYAYQWRTGNTNIGAGGPSYIITQADIGRVVSCIVTATNAGGSVSAPNSNNVTIVDPATLP